MADGGNVIDRLEIEIEASAKGVGHVLDGLESDLKRLKAVMSSIDTKALTNIQKAVNQTNNTSASPKVDTTSMSRAERDISNSVNKLKQSLAGLEAYKNAALSGDTSSMTSFERRVISIQSSINVLGEKLRGLGDTKVNSNAFIDVENKITETQSKLEELKTKMNDAISSKAPISVILDLHEQIVNTKGEIDSLIDKQSAMLKNGTAYADPFQGYREGLAQVQDALNAASQEVANFKAQSQSTDDAGTSKLESALQAVSAAASDASKKMWSMVGKGIKSAFSGIASTLSKLKSSITNIGNATDKGFNKGFKTILKYGLGIRSTYVLFKRLKTAVKDSFTELQKSGAFYQTTKANLDGLKASLSTLKYQFGATFEPIFNTVAPALQTLINYLVTVMNTLSAFIAKLTGKSTYSKAVASTAAIASNTGSAAGSAKEMNKQLQGFDELNNLSGDTGSGGSGGGGSSSKASNVHYVEESVESALGSFMSSIADDIENGDWESVGSKISTKLADTLSKIDWDDIYDKASDFGTNLANFLKGLITPSLFEEVGKTIGNSLKTMLTTTKAFATAMDEVNEEGKTGWQQFGDSIASGINSFVSTNPLSLVVENFNSWAKGILSTLISAIDGTDWKTIADHIATAIGNIDVSGIAWDLGKLANSLANALYTLVSNKDTWSNLGTKLGEGITSFFKGMNSKDANTGLTGWQALGKSLQSVFSGAKEAFVKAFEGVDWGEVGKGVKDLIGSLPLGDIAVTITGITATIALAEAAKKALLAVLSADAMTVIGGLGTVSVGTVAVSVTLAATFGWKIGTKLYESASGHEVNQGFIETISDIWKGITEDGIDLNLLDFISFTVDDAEGWYGTYRDWVYDLVDYIREDFETLKSEISTAWKTVWYGQSDVAHGYNGAPSDAVKYIESQQTSDLEEAGANLWQGIYNGFEKAMKITNPLLTPILWLKDKILSWWSDTFEEHSPAKAMYPLGENLWRGIYEGFKQAMSDYSLSDLITNVKNVLLGDDEEETVATGTHSKRAETISEEGKTKLKNGTLQLNIKTKLTGDATSKKDVENLSTAFGDLTTEADKDTDATYKAEVGGQLSQASDIDTWKTKFNKLRDKWSGKSATMSATTGGQISNINDLSGTNGEGGWAKKFTSLTDKWKSPEEATFKATTGGQITSINDLSGTDGKGGWLKKFNTLRDGWKGTSATFKTESDTTNVENSMKKGGSYYNAVANWKKTTTATFNTSANGNVDMTDLNNSKKNWSGTTTANFNTKADGNLSNQTWTNLNNSVSTWNGKTATATFDTYVDASAVTNAMNDPNSAINQAYYKWPTWGNTATMYMNFSGDTTGLDTFINNVKSKINQLTIDIQRSGSGSQKANNLASGGVISNGSLYRNLPQYAGGTLNAGSMFIAGEKGPEILGHINGRTEILNKSQIASTVNHAIVSGMMRFRSMQLRTPESIASDTITTSSYNGNTFSKDYEDAINEQNRLIAEQNELLRRIADKDVSISARDVFNAAKGEANRYYRRTGNSPFLF